jgi:hypothetical protein
MSAMERMAQNLLDTADRITKAFSSEKKTNTSTLHFVLRIPDKFESAFIAYLIKATGDKNVAQPHDIPLEFVCEEDVAKGELEIISVKFPEFESECTARWSTALRKIFFETTRTSKVLVLLRIFPEGFCFKPEQGRDIDYSNTYFKLPSLF